MKYTNHFSTKETPQTEPIPGKNMVANNGGGFSFAVDKWEQFRRFLILGSEGGTYYVSEKALTVENAKNTIECIKENGYKAIQTITEISQKGSAPKNDPAIFALALAATFAEPFYKKLAYSAIPSVCRTGTHLFQFCEAVQKLRGWSRGLRSGVAAFYLNKPINEVAYQIVKYGQRNGWTHKDVIRLSHPHADTPERNSLLAFTVGKEPAEALPDIVLAAEEIKSLSTSKKDIAKAIDLIERYKLPREVIPTEMLNNKEIWEALLVKMPLTALVRNLGKMTSVGLLTTNFDDAVKDVVSKLGDKEYIRSSRLHPIAILTALKTYSSGHGLKGKLSWNPVSSVTNALDEAFYMAFDNVERTGKNFLLALDVSSSMTMGTIAGSPLNPREASAALAMVTLRTEPYCELVGFTNTLRRLSIAPQARLTDVIASINRLPFSSTNCALPMQFATQHRLPVDVFQVYTDNETNTGTMHPSQALQEFRRTTGRNAKLVVHGMTATQFSIADPADKGMVDVCGFDVSVPEVVRQFVLE